MDRVPDGDDAAEGKDADGREKIKQILHRPVPPGVMFALTISALNSGQEESLIDNVCGRMQGFGKHRGAVGKKPARKFY